MKYAYLFILSAIPYLINAQQPPITDLFMFQIVQLSDTSWAAHSPQLLTGEDQTGYNNQPHFLSDDEVLFTQQKRGEKTTDIIKIDLKRKTRKNLTRTELSEYSPTPTPDGSSYSVIRVEKDGSQTLWKYSLDVNGSHQNLFPEFKEKIGYQTWLSDTLLGLFVLGDPSTLRIANNANKLVSTYSSDIGRCLKTSSDNKLIYVHKYSDSFWYLKKFDPLLHKIEIITEVPVGYQDFEMMDDNYIILGQESNLLIYSLAQKEWFPLTDLSPFGIQKISRLTYRNGQLVLVNSNP